MPLKYNELSQAEAWGHEALDDHEQHETLSTAELAPATASCLALASYAYNAIAAAPSAAFDVGIDPAGTAVADASKHFALVAA